MGAVLDLNEITKGYKNKQAEWVFIRNAIKSAIVVVVKHFCNTMTQKNRSDTVLETVFDNYYMSVALRDYTKNMQNH